jgi:hypothetical protein
MTTKEYYTILAIEALVRASMAPITQEYNQRPGTAQFLGTSYLKKLFPHLENAEIIYQAHVEDNYWYSPVAFSGHGELIFRAIVSLQFSQSLSLATLYMGIREADRYFFCNFVDHSPFTDELDRKSGYCKELC